MAARRSVSLATYYVWSDLLYGPDHRNGVCLWDDTFSNAEAISTTIKNLSTAVVVSVRNRSGSFETGYLPGGIGI